MRRNLPLLAIAALLISILIPIKARAAELNVNLCKLPYTLDGRMNTIGFPRIPYRLPNVGSHRQLIVAVDFPDARFTGNVKELLEKVMRPELATDYFSYVSYGKVKVEFDIYPEIVSLPDQSSTYGGDKSNTVLKDGIWSNDLIHKAAIRVLDQKIDLSKYSALATFVTGGETLSTGGAWASPVIPGFFNFKNGSFNHASIYAGANLINLSDARVTENFWRILVHEIGHLFGLLDIYMYEGGSNKQTTMGPFDAMAHAQSFAPTFTAWNRWLLDWVTDSQIVCLDINSPDIKREISAVNTKAGTKAVVVRISNTKLLVIESRRSDAHDSMHGNDGLLVYTVDMNIKSGAGAIRVVPEVNEMTSLPESIFVGDSIRYLTATLRPAEFISYEGLLIENVSATDLSDMLQMTSGVTAKDRLKEVQALAAKKVIDEAALIASAKSSRTFFTNTSCQHVGGVAIFQSFVGGSWKDVGYANGWIKGQDCPSERPWSPWIITELPSSTKYRWKISMHNDVFFWYSNESTSPLTLADEEAKLKAALEAKAKAEAEEKAKAEELIRTRELARSKGELYQDDGCHSYGTSAVFQTQVSGVWTDYKAADGWQFIASCISTNPLQPWVIAQLPSLTTYRWKVSAPNWKEDWYSKLGISPQTEADRLAALQAAEEAAKAEALKVQTKTIKCVKGKVIKKVTDLKPKCPKGFKKK